jgi:hypothetical protein
VLAIFTSATEQLHLLLRSLGLQECALPCYYLVRVRPLRSFIDLWMRELATHGCDICSRFEPSAHLSTESLSVFVHTHFVLTGVAASSMDPVVENATAQLQAASENPAHLRFCCDMETFVLLLCGRLRLETAIVGGRVVSKGNPELVAILDQQFKGV